MAEKHQRRLEDAFRAMGESIEKNHTRPLQKAAYLCMAGCFDNPRLSQEAVSNCMQRCEMPLKQVNAVVKQEINGFQDRMQRCAMGCQDEAKDLAPSDAKEGDRRLDKVIKQHEKCIGVCVDKHLKVLPSIESRIKAASIDAAR